jgi:hypothetical protein
MISSTKKMEGVNFCGGLSIFEVFFIYKNPKFRKPPYFLTLSKNGKSYLRQHQK